MIGLEEQKQLENCLMKTVNSLLRQMARWGHPYPRYEKAVTLGEVALHTETRINKDLFFHIQSFKLLKTSKNTDFSINTIMKCKFKLKLVVLKIFIVYGNKLKYKIACLSVNFLVCSHSNVGSEAAAAVNLSANTRWLCTLLYGPEEDWSGVYTLETSHKLSFRSLCLLPYLRINIRRVFRSKTDGCSLIQRRKKFASLFSSLLRFFTQGQIVLEG